MQHLLKCDHYTIPEDNIYTNNLKVHCDGIWTCSLSVIILSYLLAFVQLTWQVDNG